MNVLVVDDEVLERQALQMFLQEGFPEAKIVGEAANGRVAIELADECRPDLVLMDIKMPGIDGVQAVKEIKKRHPNTKFIMISAFDTFEYAKEVMQQGVKEYLLKPCRKEEVLDAVRRIYEEWVREEVERKRRLELQEKLNEALTYLEANWMEPLLQDHEGMNRFAKWKEIYDVSEESGFIVLYSLSRLTKEADRRQSDWYDWLKRQLQHKSSYRCFIGPFIGHQVPVLYTCAGRASDDSRSEITKIAAECRRLFRSYDQEWDEGVITAGIGLRYAMDTSLIHSYYEAAFALQCLSGSTKHALLSGEEAFRKKGEAGASFPYESETALLEAVRTGDPSAVMQTFDLYLHDLGEHYQGNAKGMFKAVEEFFVILRRMLYDFGFSLQSVEEMLAEPSDWEALRREAGHTLRSMAEAIRLRRKEGTQRPLQEAKRYVDDHYAEPLSLEKVAAHIGWSPYYFSKMFKAQYDVTFIEYLTQVRVEKAKQHMRDADVSLKEICYRVGYRDPNYFSRVFKKMTGLSPSEYRQQYNGQ